MGEKNKKATEIEAWFAGRIPGEWFEALPQVTSDREEILVMGRLQDVQLGDDAGPEAVSAGREGRIRRFREETRQDRIRIAAEAEHRFGRKVSWGVECGDVRKDFTTLSLPIMTRLRMEDRKVLDTLVEAGVARSRSHALAWCVRLVGQNEAEWIEKLRGALDAVQQVRSQGPATGAA